MMNITIYTPNPGPRLKYTAGFIFRDVWQADFKIVSDLQDIREKDFLINYSATYEEGAFWIYPSGLLEENEIRKIDPAVIHEEGIPCLFPVSDGDIEFDVFAAVFYMLSRYEEYVSSEKDQYGRFKASSSVAWKEQYIEKPVVNQWLIKLSSLLEEKYPRITPLQLRRKYLPTVDIDNPWAYLHKPFIRFAGGIIKDLVLFRRGNLLRRMRVLSGKKRDPYDSYDNLLKFHDKQLRMFLLIGSRDKHDNKIPVNNSYWQELITRLSYKFTVGLHPSFQSHRDKKYLVREKRSLEEITGKPVTMSRQHFLKMEIPNTYRNLISLGITEDHTMGYAEVIGFRAGTSYSFNFFDLEKEEETNLRIFPFTVMDRTLKDYMKLDPEDAKKRISQLVARIQEFGGNFVSVWHNEALGDSEEWTGWIEVYEHMQKEVKTLLSADNERIR